MAITLREKKIANGRVSLYLDFCRNGKRWFEFLKIYVNKERPAKEDKTKRQLANEIKIKREHEIIVESHGLPDKQKKRADFITFFESFMAFKKANSHRTTTLKHLKDFSGQQAVPIAKISAEWMKELESHLLKSVNENSAFTYLTNVNTALNELVRKNIIASNPWHDVPKHERLRKKEVTRTAWTLEQLTLLVNTPCGFEAQMKQAFMLACFTGLRWSDINKLAWRSIIRKNINDREEYFIQFEQQKTESKEIFPLSPEAIRILKEREQEVKREGVSQYVFPKVKETNLKSKAVYSKVNYNLKKWAKAAGLEECMSFHTARHSFATNLLEALNGDIYTVSKLLGHKSVRTTEIYAKVRDAVKRKAVQSLPMLSIIPPLYESSDSKAAA